ncbi:hypothetical protein [Noviherbaspirillum denitrificans]|uniref:Uncharacterized protein n=1 Tax=Noviherbaspirillum denitrificans TaxID=1968433 RepID=A0A254TI39_9BURK|nr:hypothetical protein [Noviherbaspirillum denitrificans]OWW22299.1 hypothetical protein AYR66_25185 [Noviherbaspirillum denitrificans]
MDAMKSTIAAVVWLVAGTAVAQTSSGEEAAAGADPVLALNIDATADQPDSSRRIETYSLPAYRLPSAGKIHAAAGLVPLQTSAASASFIQGQTGIDTHAMLSADRWLAREPGLARTFAVGHAWRDLTLEGTIFSSQDDGRDYLQRETRKIDSRSARLSFSPVENWIVRVSRGSVSGLDHLVAGEEVRRTAISATYRRAFAEGDWEATVAWGRNSRKFRESTMGYLVESAFRFDGVHSVFGRVEQVGSDDIGRENESLQRQLFMMNKLTVGYSRDVRLAPALGMDAGVFATRYFVPSGMAPSYGSGPTAYMMFIRLKMQ